MFERFTERARRTVVLAQQEARELEHDHVGTEHLLLGLLQQEDGIASQALETLGIALEDARQRVEDVVGRGEGPPIGHIPFAPDSKRVLEAALREALRLGHDHIDTEDILLGLMTVRDGVAARILRDMGASQIEVRTAVLGIIQGGSERTTGSFLGSKEVAGVGGPKCPGCGRSIEETAIHRSFEVPSETEESGPAQIRVLFCTACGTTLGTSFDA